MSEVVEGLVSTIIPVFNRSAMLRDAVDSVLAQTYRPIEILITDDASTDGTRQTVDEIAAAEPGIVRVAHHPKNLGAGPARETGMRLARGEFIQYLDSDDLLLPDKFELQVQALRRNPDCGIAYGFIRLLRQDGTVMPGAYKGSGDGLSSLFPRLLFDRWWNTDCPLFRRSACDAAGPWSDLRYSEDWEYEARVGAQRIRLTAVPEYVCVQRQHAGARQTGDGRWLSPADQVRFFRVLYQSALAAGVSKAAPEMRHFARWVFSASRAAARAGDDGAAVALFELADQASVSHRFELGMYQGLSRQFGWRRTAAAAETVAGVLGRRAGRDTLKQSWMVAEENFHG